MTRQNEDTVINQRSTSQQSSSKQQCFQKTMKMFLQAFLVIALVQVSAAFAPNSVGITSRAAASTQLFAKAEYDEKIASCKDLLRIAAVTKTEDPDLVLTALEDLEKLMKQKRKEEGEEVAQQVLDNLTGEWRLIFTTGTKKTQERSGKINYFPLKAIQAFDATTDPMYIENAIYVGDFALVKFRGNFEFDLRKSKVSCNLSTL